jgi:hypothetical protein
MIVLPIMLYNQIQLLLGAVLARRYAATADRVKTPCRKRYETGTTSPRTALEGDRALVLLRCY